MAYSEKEIRIARERHNVAQEQITLINKQIGELIRQRARNEATVAETALIMQGIEPCTICKRLVLSPCNSAEDFQLNGPWDTFCQDFIYG